MAGSETTTTTSFGRTSWLLLKDAIARILKGHELLASAVALVLLLLGVFNERLGKLATDSYDGVSGWWAAAVVGALLLWGIFRAHYERVAELTHAVADSRGRGAELEREVESLKEVGPTVSFGEPRTAETPMRGGGAQPFA